MRKLILLFVVAALVLGLVACSFLQGTSETYPTKSATTPLSESSAPPTAAESTVPPHPVTEPPGESTAQPTIAESTTPPHPVTEPSGESTAQPTIAESTAPHLPVTEPSGESIAQPTTAKSTTPPRPTSKRTTPKTAPPTTAKSTAPPRPTTRGLKTMDDKVQYVESQLKTFLKNKGMTDVYHVVFSNDGKELWIQVFIKEKSKFAQKIAGYEKDFSANSALSKKNRAEWNAWTEACRKFCVEVTQKTQSQTRFQFGGVSIDVLLQINNGKIVVNRLVK